MAKLIDLTGQKFGKLTVIAIDHKRKTPSGQTKTMWLCKCDCGNEKIVEGQALRCGETSSCGCYRREYVGNHNRTHGLSDSRIYHIHKTMIARCEVPTSYRYGYYGAKGVTVCDEWHDFEKFYEWSMSNGYNETLTLDRIDVNKGYCPENCRWVDWTVQQNNKSSNHILEYNGEKHTVKEWERITGFPVASRLSDGWSVERALTQKKRKVKNEQCSA